MVLLFALIVLDEHERSNEVGAVIQRVRRSLRTRHHISNFGWRQTVQCINNLQIGHRLHFFFAHHEDFQALGLRDVLLAVFFVQMERNHLLGFNIIRSSGLNRPPVLLFGALQNLDGSSPRGFFKCHC